mmetsp:Transcript_23372/g.38941  ORF Transcript_23372/g.38941 Transcript_23372/m.38941 type:complete len:80 (-) Transcript_23372:77-316(-)
MGFSLYSIFKACLLIANGVAILHPKRFLAQHGYDQIDNSMDSKGLKNQIVGLLQAVTYLKVPLIVINCLIIFIELLFGG